MGGAVLLSGDVRWHDGRRVGVFVGDVCADLSDLFLRLFLELSLFRCGVLVLLVF